MAEEGKLEKLMITKTSRIFGELILSSQGEERAAIQEGVVDPNFYSKFNEGEIEVRYSKENVVEEIYWKGKRVYPYKN